MIICRVVWLLIGQFDSQLQRFYWFVRSAISKGISLIIEFSYNLGEQEELDKHFQYIRTHCLHCTTRILVELQPVCIQDSGTRAYPTLRNALVWSPSDAPNVFQHAITPLSPFCREICQ